MLCRSHLQNVCKHHSLQGAPLFFFYLSESSCIGFKASTSGLLRISFLASGKAPLYHSIWYNAKLLNIYNARKQDEKQLLSPMVAMVLMFLDPRNMGEHSPVLSVPISTFSGLSETCLVTADPIPHTHSLSEVLHATGFCHTMGAGTGHRLSPRCHHSTSTIQSTSLHLHDKPCNPPQWAILGDGRPKLVLMQVTLLFYWLTILSYISWVCVLYKMILKIKGDRQESWALWYLFSKFMVGSVYVSIRFQCIPQSLGQNKTWSGLLSPLLILIPFFLFSVEEAILSTLT